MAPSNAPSAFVRLSIPAGRMLRASTGSRSVTPDSRPGRLEVVYLTQEGLHMLTWTPCAAAAGDEQAPENVSGALAADYEEFLLCHGDAVFEPVGLPARNNIFVLKLQSSGMTKFFWLQSHTLSSPGAATNVSDMEQVAAFVRDMTASPILIAMNASTFVLETVRARQLVFSDSSALCAHLNAFVAGSVDDDDLALDLFDINGAVDGDYNPEYDDLEDGDDDEGEQDTSRRAVNKVALPNSTMLPAAAAQSSSLFDDHSIKAIAAAIVAASAQRPNQNVSPAALETQMREDGRKTLMSLFSDPGFLDVLCKATTTSALPDDLALLLPDSVPKTFSGLRSVLRSDVFESSVKTLVEAACQTETSSLLAYLGERKAAQGELTVASGTRVSSLPQQQADMTAHSMSVAAAENGVNCTIEKDVKAQYDTAEALDVLNKSRSTKGVPALLKAILAISTLEKAEKLYPNNSENIFEAKTDQDNLE